MPALAVLSLVVTFTTAAAAADPFTATVDWNTVVAISNTTTTLQVSTKKVK